MKWSARRRADEFLKPSGYTGEGTVHRERTRLERPGLRQGRQTDPVPARRPPRSPSSGDGKFVTLVDKYKGKRLNSPNDLVVHNERRPVLHRPAVRPARADGRPGEGTRLPGRVPAQAEGRTDAADEGDDAGRTASACRPDEKTLYVANSDPDKAIWMAFPVKADGTSARARCSSTRPPVGEGKKPGLPDGLKVDKDGNMFATGPGGVFVFDKDGKHLGTHRHRRADRQLRLGRRRPHPVHHRRQATGAGEDRHEGPGILRPRGSRRGAGRRASGGGRKPRAPPDWP